MEKFEVCIRAIIRHQNKILVCYHKEKGYYFFPGGHLNFGESIPKALLREIKEELGIGIKKYSFVGLVDNIYEEDNQRHHEINLVFNVIPDKISEESKEGHIDFVFFDKNRFSKEKILPRALQKAILRWLKNKKIFWVSQIYDKVTSHF
ncbi:NUDIX domain-containing protein [bacterium]|nr:NUDIX domain-containing protein [bacterium]